ncbi:MAG: isoprenylcysteine carboxylmethyltransferase family protein [Thiothrix sp.]|nr:MAG: isoprenylcysteine carboxylmethyltransferase family protein [Thiothrix sp.]
MPKLKIPPPVYMLMFAFCMWLMDRYIPLAEWISTPWNRIGFFIMGLAFFTDLSSLLQFFRYHTTPSPIHPERVSTLVTDGAYRYSRNPMYLGLLILLCGWSTYLGSISPLLLLPLFIFVINNMQIRCEERILEKKFSTAYRAYKQSVRRWI